MPDLITTTGPGVRQTPALAQALRQFPEEGAGAVSSRLRTTTGEFKRRMQERSSTGPLFRRSGRAFNSWSNNVGGSKLSDITGVVGSFVFYMRDHDVGGTFRPRKALWFWVPVGPNLNAKRRARVSVKQAQRKIDAGEWRFSRRARGTTDRTVFGRTAAVLNENDELVYVLIREKTLKPVLQLTETGDSFDATLIERLVSDFDRYWAQPL